MLATQVQYWELQEKKRHNVATEGQAQQELAESKRHNMEVEGANWFSVKENERHNRATESLGFATLAESTRHNRSTEELERSKQAETRRHNTRTENESIRHNLVSESLSKKDISSQVGLRSSQSKLNFSTITLNKKKGQEAVSKTVKNYVDSAATVSSEARSWLGR